MTSYKRKVPAAPTIDAAKLDDVQRITIHRVDGVFRVQFVFSDETDAEALLGDVAPPPLNAQLIATLEATLAASKAHTAV